MLEAAANGAREAGAEVETVNLYALDFKGLPELLCCQRVGAAARCAAQDALTPVLNGFWRRMRCSWVLPFTLAM